MQLLDLGRVLADRDSSGQRWLEFLRVPALSMGVYHLKAGQADLQQPHNEDEVYYVLSGAARFRAAAEEQQVRAGALIYVERHCDHRFFDITEDLTVLVFFAPAEGSAASSSA